MTTNGNGIGTAACSPRNRCALTAVSAILGLWLALLGGAYYLYWTAGTAATLRKCAGFTIVWLCVCATAWVYRNRALWVLAGVALICACMWLTPRSPFYPDEGVLRAARPYVMFLGEPGYVGKTGPQMGGIGQENEIRLNGLGLRGPLPVRPKPTGEYRVLVFGGSTVFNGAPLEKTIPGQLELLYRQAGFPTVRVYNWGVVSSVSSQDLALLVHYGLDYQPDLVIFYGGGNDIITSVFYDPRPGYPINFLQWEASIRNSVLTAGWAGVVCGLYAHVPLLAQTFYEELDERMFRRRALIAQAQQESPAWREQVAAVYATNLAKAGVIGRGGGFRVAAVLQPLVFFKKRTAAELKLGMHGPLLEELVRDVYGKYVAHLDAARKSLGDAPLTLIDIHDALAETPENLYWDFIHTDNRGNELIARSLHRRLLAAGLHP